MPAHARRTGLCFDGAKAEALIGFVGSLMLLTISVPVAYDAAARLLLPAADGAGTAIGVLWLGICVNIAIAFLILGPQGDGTPANRGAELAGPVPVGVADGRAPCDAAPLARLAVVGQLVDAEVSLILLIGLAVADLCGWVFLDALAGLAGSFLISISASKIMLREATMLVDLRAPAA